MRFEGYLKRLIVQLAVDAWGRDSKLYLFGSRVDATKLGGDINLAIDCNLPSEEFLSRKRQFKRELILKNIEFPIDIIQLNTLESELLLSEIKKTAVQLYPSEIKPFVLSLSKHEFKALRETALALGF